MYDSVLIYSRHHAAQQAASLPVFHSISSTIDARDWSRELKSGVSNLRNSLKSSAGALQSITAFTSLRTNLSPFIKGCREWDASMWLPEFLRGFGPNNSSWAESSDSPCTFHLFSSRGPKNIIQFWNYIHLGTFLFSPQCFIAPALFGTIHCFPKAPPMPNNRFEVWNNTAGFQNSFLMFDKTLHTAGVGKNIIPPSALQFSLQCFKAFGRF